MPPGRFVDLFAAFWKGPRVPTQQRQKQRRQKWAARRGPRRDLTGARATGPGATSAVGNEEPTGSAAGNFINRSKTLPVAKLCRTEKPGSVVCH